MKKKSFIYVLASVFGISLVSQVIGLVRQILIAAYFGISRELDIYFMTFAVATVIVLSFSVIFDTAGIPHLIAALEKKGVKAHRALTGSIFSASVCSSFILSAAFVLLTPLAALFMAAGFSPSERHGIFTFAFYFLPWTLVSIPYYALASFYKSIRHFNTVLASEAVMAACSVLFLVLWHTRAQCIPLAMGFGQLVSFMWLFSMSFKHFNLIGRLDAPEMKPVYRNFLELFGATQVGSLSSVIERFFYSFLMPGGISVIGHVSKVINNLSGTLAFREIFIVPLSSLHMRAQKLERAVIGLAFVTVPIMVFCALFSTDVVTILFKRGQFGAHAVAVSSGAMSIFSLSLLPAVINAPMFRMFQVIDRIKNTAAIYFMQAITLFLLGGILVFALKLDVSGIALMIVINMYITMAVSAYLLHKSGLSINIARALKYTAYALAASLIAGSASKFALSAVSAPFIRLTAEALMFIIVFAAFSLPVKERLIKIVK